MLKDLEYIRLGIFHFLAQMHKITPHVFLVVANQQGKLRYLSSAYKKEDNEMLIFCSFFQSKDIQNMLITNQSMYAITKFIAFNRFNFSLALYFVLEGIDINLRVYFFRMGQQSQWQKGLGSLQITLNQLQQSLSTRTQRFNPFRTVFVQFFKACDKFAQSLITIADGCDQEILSTLTESEENLGSIYLNLKGGLIGIAQTWRQIALRSRNELLQPLKVFADNYRKVGNESMGKLKTNLTVCLAIREEAVRSRQAYYTSCERLEKHKQGQAKIMMKIQNGEQGQLQRFNRTTKNLLEKVSSTQKKYKEIVEKANEETTKLRAQLQKQSLSLRDNQSARVQFLKKIAINQSKLMQLGKQINLNLKNEQSLVRIDAKGRTQFTDIIQKVENASKSKTLQYYISHEQLIKSKKHKEFQQQNPLLMELFSKIKQNEKNSMVQFVQGCLQLQPASRLVSIQKGIKNEYKMVLPPQWQNFKQKMFSLNHYLFYFAFLLHRQLHELPNYYIKLTPPFFSHLSKLLSILINQIDIFSESPLGELGISTLYKILKLGERVVEKRKERIVIGNLKVLIQDLGQCKKLRQEKSLKKLLSYLSRKGKKRVQAKGMMGFTKGLFSTLTGKKDDLSITEEQQFNALVELTHLMANLCLPSEVTLPLLKKILKNSSQASYQYLKDILQGRRDREERQKLVLQQDPKNKLEKEFKMVIQHKRIPLKALQIVAERGFLDLQGVKLRLCCKALYKIHLSIIYKLPIHLGLQLKFISNPSPISKYLLQAPSILQGQKQCEVEQVILLDVNRSLHLHIDQLSHDQLKQFLIYYARQHPKMAYCQGMNYLAGFIMLKTRIQPHCYSVFCEIMDKYFLQIFINNFEGMKLKMYLFQRLLSIFHPDLSDHFKRQMITPECYAVGWIITAFTSVYQYTRKSVVVDWLWARFAMWGWREFYRLTMGLLQIRRESLLASGYDGCLQILGELAKSDILLSSDPQTFAKQFGGQLESMLQIFPISDRLLLKLTGQFQHE